MQAQATRTETKSITATQSLAAVQTMLRAALGCITYLRDLLPEENFAQSQLIAAEDLSVSDQSSDGSFSSATSKRSRSSNGFTITTMKRGYSDEGDKILNYLENGIFHALQNEYLRSFIFAIYLDSKDPSNIVEAYTFNFQYYALPGTKTAIPIMTLGDGLQKMTLKNKMSSIKNNHITDAIKNGQLPTLLDVKKSVKALLKTLIQATTQMEVLPKRRFATFKLFYTDKTPADYEPPHFQPGDEEKDKWFFMTHDLNEVPDKWSIGKVNTGHHSVNMSVTSVATYLPSSTQLDKTALEGIVSRPFTTGHITPVQEATIRAAQNEEQLKDAEKRNVAWSTEEAVELDDLDLDGEGEDDPDYIRLPDSSYIRVISATSENLIPAGIRNQDTGDIEIFDRPVDLGEAHFGGTSEVVPTKLNEVNKEKANQKSNIEQTQILEEFSQNIPPSSSTQANSGLGAEDNFTRDDNDSSWALPSTSPITSVLSGDINMDVLKDLNTLSSIEDGEVLDMETQIESIQSFEKDSALGRFEAKEVLSCQMSTSKQDHPMDNGLNCACGITVEDEVCFCEGPCGNWYHTWCMGYHSVKDQRLPEKFYCFSCRFKADPSWPLIKADIYPVMLLRFQELALFRRAIKAAETSEPGTISKFAKENGFTYSVSRRLLSRLRKEGFVTEQAAISDEIDFLLVRPNNPKSGRKTKKEKNTRKLYYLFNRSIVKNQPYADYFNPDFKVEGALLKVSELLKPQQNGAKAAVAQHSTHQLDPEGPQACKETQTQEETQAPLKPQTEPPHQPQKRSNEGDDHVEDDASRAKKKVKISVVGGLDLAE